MLLFLYGENTYQLQEKLKQIKEKFIKDIDPSRLNLDTVDGSKEGLEKMISTIKASPFLAEKRLIVIENIFSNKSSDIVKSLGDFIKNSSEVHDDNFNIIVFVQDGSKLGRTSFAQFLKKSKYVYEFKPLEGFAINKWIKQYVRGKEARIDEDAIKSLVSLVGNDLWQLESELDKLIAYAGDRRISNEFVHILVSGNFDDNIFHLVDALGNKQKRVALRLLHEQLELGAHEIYLLTMLTRQFRILIQVKEMVQMNHTKKEISLTLKLHPFVIKKTIEQSRNYTFDQLKKVYSDLVRMDIALKGGLTKANGKILFDLLICKL